MIHAPALPRSARSWPALSTAALSSAALVAAHLATLLAPTPAEAADDTRAARAQKRAQQYREANRQDQAVLAALQSELERNPPAAGVAPAQPPAAMQLAVATPAPGAQPSPAVLAAQLPAAPRAGNPEGRFDLSVNNAPAPQVFMQLAAGTPFNILVAPEVTGSISITLRDTTVLEAMESLREMFGYDFKVTGNRIFVYPNTVQTRLYRVNYLPGRRQGASDIRVTSSAISQAGGSGGSAASGGSVPASATGGGASRGDDSAHVRTTSDADFWREVQASLQMLVGGKDGRSVVMNIAAGVIMVKATPAEQRQVDQYLRAVQLSIERQVMLEAKIVEVRLSRDAQTGINWAAFGKLFGSNTSAAIGVTAPGTTLTTSGQIGNADGTTVGVGAQLVTGTLGKGFYGLALQGANFAALLNFLQTQGDVSVLSSPRIATLNNQKAVLKVGSDELFVTGISTTTTTSGSNSVSTPSVQLQPFFSGIALDVTPQIDETGHVMLHVHPSISTVAEKTKNVDLGSLGSFKLPLAASIVNETDSIVRVKDGQIVAIGGLMKHEVSNDRAGVAGLQDAPVFGGLFRQTGVVDSKRELVIMLKPTVIGNDAWPDAPVTSQAK